MAISEEFLSALRDRTSIEDLVSSYVTLKRRGKNLVGLCPFHSEKTPSFTLYPENGSFYCFGCGAGGDVITFVRRMENLDRIEAIKFLAQRAGMRMPEDGFDDTLSKRRQRILAANREAAKFFHSQLLLPENSFALDYFTKDRRLSMQTVRHFGLGYAPGRWDALLRHMQQAGFSDNELADANLVRRSTKNENSCYDAFRARVMIPIIDIRGNVIAFGGRVLDDSKPKYINTSDTLVYKKSREIFALNFAKNSGERRLILCEGYMDVIALHQADFLFAVAGCGTALTQEQAHLISRYADEVLLCYDSDEAGQEALRKAIGIFSSIGMKIKVLKLTGGKDPDEIIRKFGRERFSALLDGAANDVEFRILALRDRFDVTTDDGKVQFLKSATELLASLDNLIERDVYTSRMADELNVDKAALNAQIEQTRARMRRQKKRTQMDDLTKSLTVRRDPLNPEMQQHYRAAKAEEAILTLLMNNNDFIAAVSDELSEDSFITSFHRHVYSCLMQCWNTSGEVDIPHLSAYFDPEEIGRVTRIYMKRGVYANTIDELRECIRTLDEEREKLTQQDVQIEDDDAFLNSFQRMKENKQ
ncbi:MAG: DNA primase [Clostridia bacterium]|nr:DNA primase [Clostridia bacterium]